jgi:hypothetical protein
MAPELFSHMKSRKASSEYDYFFHPAVCCNYTSCIAGLSYRYK